MVSTEKLIVVEALPTRIHLCSACTANLAEVHVDRKVQMFEKPSRVLHAERTCLSCMQYKEYH